MIIYQHHDLFLNFETLAGLWPCAIEPSLKIEVLKFFHYHHEISDPYRSPLKSYKAEILAPGVFWANLLYLILRILK
jgi:hypothetical protein